MNSSTFADMSFRAVMNCDLEGAYAWLEESEFDNFREAVEAKNPESLAKIFGFGRVGTTNTRIQARGTAKEIELTVDGEEMTLFNYSRQLWKDAKSRATV